MYCRWASEYYRTSAILNELVGCESNLTANTARHGVLLWAHVVTAHEEDLPRDAHRDHSPYLAKYLRRLHSIGYPISDVEQRILDNAPEEPDSETADPAAVPDDEPTEPATDDGVTPAA